MAQKANFTIVIVMLIIIMMVNTSVTSLSAFPSTVANNISSQPVLSASHNTQKK
ncbi:MAG: hypothetical protein AB7V56_15670 [Candidatus Nitrosocosmicus sp.]|uniref:hypothetical protein n=1 Tax=Candidatus Nitrosocosmicus agrestis TaxID=2563600 RepID=UPI0012B66641|nr:hypothetical protein [Candidatus Nitrosocosmicus sp. SS]MDR4492465.1 hypothetical protein [Candidatus Nitrosocosmicus sp.]